MEVQDAILNRRSIRQYLDEPVTDDQISELLKAAMYAPSAVNKQPWHFIVFRDRATIRTITEKHPNASMLHQAGAAILVCWDEHLQHDTGYGPVDCAAATQNILLRAYSMGIGSVWVGLYPRQQRMEMAGEIFNLPSHIKGFSIVSLGYPAENKMQPQRFNRERIHFEKW
ncbi:MAG TPA: nitroreductase family protein [Bacteroidales bacterium]|jgi:nitroreductase|nr:nitroreductase family protein [Bacteroidales bacterium]